MGKNILKPLTMQQMQAIAFIEGYHYRYEGKFPSKAAIERYVKNFDVDQALMNPTFRISLVNRGIEPPVGPLNDAELNKPKNLTNEQVSAVITIVNFEDKRSRAVKLKELGITPSQWQGWLKDKEFKTFLHTLSGANLESARYVANEALIKAMDRGDVNAIKFYNEMASETSNKPAARETQNIRTILARVVEAIQRHVHDPDTLRLIGEDFEAILNNEIEPSRRMEKSMNIDNPETYETDAVEVNDIDELEQLIEGI